MRVADLVRDDELAAGGPSSESGIGSLRARGSSCAAWVKYQSRWRFSTFWNMRTEPLRISPVRGSLTCGPTAFSVVLGQPADHRVADVLGRPVGIVGRRVAATMPFLEAGRLERGLPVDDRLAHPRLPLLRRVRVDVVDDRLLRRAEAARVGGSAHSSRYCVMYWRRAARCSAPKSTHAHRRRSRRARRSGAASSAARGGARCSSARARSAPDAALPAAARRRRRRRAGRGCVPVCVASTSTLSGKAIARSMNERVGVDLAADGRELGDARREEARHVDRRRRCPDRTPRR